MARNAIRSVVKLRSAAGTGNPYGTKTRRNDPERLVMRNTRSEQRRKPVPRFADPVQARELAHRGELYGVPKSNRANLPTSVSPAWPMLAGSHKAPAIF